jgi:hypothetical protein
VFRRALLREHSKAIEELVTIANAAKSLASMGTPGSRHGELLDTIPAMIKHRIRGSFAGAVAALTLLVGAVRADTMSLEEGSVIKITREAVLNGVSLPKGTELKIASIKKNSEGAITRVDLQQVDGDKKLFKAIPPEAVAALAATPSSSNSGDRSSIFKVAAQIPIVRELSLGTVVFGRGSVLQIDRVEKNKDGKVIKLDLRETSGAKRLMRGVTVEALLLALSPDDVTWPDGAVGRVIQLGADFQFGGISFAKGTKFVVTRVETEPKAHEIIKVDIRETEGQKRELTNVAVALLKQNGAIGTSNGVPK